jgi:hypothetical protein
VLPSVSPCPSFLYTEDFNLENLQDLLISSLPNEAGCSKYRQLALVLSYNLLRLFMCPVNNTSHYTETTQGKNRVTFNIEA